MEVQIFQVEDRRRLVKKAKMHLSLTLVALPDTQYVFSITQHNSSCGAVLLRL